MAARPTSPGSAATATGSSTRIFNFGFRTRYSDLCYGYNAFWADLLPLLDLPDHAAPAPANGKMLWGDGFEIETVINCRFAAAGVAITEVPSVEKLRIFGESNLHAVSDGLRVLKTLMTEWRRARGPPAGSSVASTSPSTRAQSDASVREPGPHPPRCLTARTDPIPKDPTDQLPPTATPAEPLTSGRTPDPGGTDRHGD